MVNVGLNVVMMARRCTESLASRLRRRGSLLVACLLATAIAGLPENVSATAIGSGPNQSIDLATPVPGETAIPEPLGAANPVAEQLIESATPVADTIELPRQLSAQDAKRYAKIFRLQVGGKWRAADREIKQLEDRALLGHVLYQRYMHPTRYRSSYEELHKWLKRYADHPGAERVYKLAVKRHIKGWKRPTRPARPALGPFAKDRGRPSESNASASRSRQYVGLPRSVRNKLRRYMRQRRPDLADKYLQKKAVRKKLSPARYDLARTKTALGYFHRNKDERAYELAHKSAERSRRLVPLSDWLAGLTAWRLGDFALAAEHFEAYGQSPNNSDWELAAGSYWAARAWLRTGQPNKVYPSLARAAAHPRTFYGILAHRQLADSLALSWRLPPLTQIELDRLVEIPAVRRSIALTEAGQSHLADAELNKLHRRAGPNLRDALLGLVTRINAPATALRMARATRYQVDGPFDMALYPMLADGPVDQFAVDRALVHALIRQESQFKSRAKSRAGARGLMQLMPSTASFIAADRSLRRRNRSTLYAPDVNLMLGQKYVNHLLEDEYVAGNLVLMIVAYNGGPGNLRKWLRRMSFQDDPLLFIEAVPARETRNYVERVLSNFWIYRHRLGQETPSLDAIASGEWPSYIALDGKPGPLASNREEGYAY